MKTAGVGSCDRWTDRRERESNRPYPFHTRVSLFMEPRSGPRGHLPTKVLVSCEQQRLHYRTRKRNADIESKTGPTRNFGGLYLWNGRTWRRRPCLVTQGTLIPLRSSREDGQKWEVSHGLGSERPVATRVQ